MGIGTGDEVTMLVRPLCQVTFWNDLDFEEKTDTSSGYLWSTSIDGVLSATCDCATDNVDLLSCELNEQFEEVQQCNYPDSPTGGICPYTFGTQTFRIEESRDGSYRMFRPLPTYEDEVEMLDLLVRPRYVMSALLSGPGSQANIRQMHALVNPHQILRITQRSLHCGSYLMRTNELKFDYEIARPNRWVLNPAAGRLYYFSRESERETRENAASKCENLGGRLAALDRPEAADFAARIVAKNFNNGTSWWTAAATIEQGEKCWLRWERGGLGNNLHLGPCREDASCILMKLFWPSDPVDRFFLTECRNQLPFVCEKFPEL